MPRREAFVVSLYEAGKRRPSDCYPDFPDTREDAVAAGEAELKRGDWPRRYTVRRVWLEQ